MKELIEAVKGLNERFGFKPEVGESVEIFMEEVSEFLEAMDPEHIAEEAVDVIWTAVGLCLARGVAEDSIERAVKKVIEKNNGKTHETHELRDGKIRRKM